jgi:hypothetical protein
MTKNLSTALVYFDSDNGKECEADYKKFHFSVAACNYIQTLINWSSDKSRQLFCQLLCKVVFCHDYEKTLKSLGIEPEGIKTSKDKKAAKLLQGWRPIQYEIIREHRAAEDFKKLISLKLLECDNDFFYDKDNPKNSKCKYYRIAKHVFDEFRLLRKIGKANRMNLFSMTKISTGSARPYKKSQSRYDKSRNKVPYISDRMARTHYNITKKPCPCNIYEFKKLLSQYEDELIRGTLSRKVAKLLPMLRKMDYIFDYDYDPQKSKFGYLSPAISFAFTGRIFESFGLQIFKPVRVALLTGIDYTNYDLEKSQLNILNYYRPSEAIQNSFTLIDTIEAMGYPKKLLKSAIYNTIFNAGYDDKLSAVKDLKRHAIKNKLSMKPIRELLEPLGDVAGELADTLVGQQQQNGSWVNKNDCILTEGELDRRIIKKVKKFVGRQNKKQKWCFNNIDKIQDETLRAKLAKTLVDCKKRAKRGVILAFYLQGLESYIIQTVINKIDERGFQVLSPQHDGLIVLGDDSQPEVQNIMSEVNKELGYDFRLVSKKISLL